MRKPSMDAGNITRLLGTSLRNRAVMANALCAQAEEEYHAGLEMRAAETVSRVRRFLGDIWLILSGEVSAVAGSDLRYAAELLDGLDGRITAIEKASKMQWAP